MKLDPAFKIEKACSSDKSRPVLTSVYLDAEAGKLVATDSYELAVVPVEVEEGDVSGLIPASAFVAWRKASSRTSTAEMSANGTVDVKGLDGSASFPRPDGQFPHYDRLVADGARGTVEGERVDLPVLAEFGVNVAELAKCAAALGSDTVRIKVYGPLKPIRVEPVAVRYGAASGGPRPESCEGAYGIVMPFRLS